MKTLTPRRKRDSVPQKQFPINNALKAFAKRQENRAAAKAAGGIVLQPAETPRQDNPEDSCKNILQTENTGAIVTHQ